MATTAVETLSVGVRRNAWWIAPQVVVGVVLGLAVGYWAAWLLYVAANSTGVWLYTSTSGSSRPRRQFWMKAMAIPLLPTGLLGVLASRRRMTPDERAKAARPGGFV
ncbi:MAG: hypothetical protein R2707_06715 [Acidimicrobiales bacterium]